MENAYHIIGSTPLKGEITLSGAKNIALKVIIAALMCDGPVSLTNIPRIDDISELLHLLTQLGAHSKWIGRNELEIDGTTLSSNKVDLLHASKIRVSFMLFAPLLHRFGSAMIPNPGGCRLGARPIDRIVQSMQQIGIKVSYDSETGYYSADAQNGVKGTVTFSKPTHTGTELVILLSIFSRSHTTIENAAREPEIDDLISFLNSCGAKIKRNGSRIDIEGVHNLTQQSVFRISSDRVEAVTYASLALATHGMIRIGPIPPHFVDAYCECIRRMGAHVEIDGDILAVRSPEKLNGINIETSPYPGFLTDWQPLMAVLLTQAQGTSEIHERIFENRFSYVTQLHKLGADIEFIEKNISSPETHYHFQYNPAQSYTQTIKITGPQKLHGGVVTVADLRAGATLAIAALAADGESYVQGVHHIERGYEDFVGKIRLLGGNIEKL